jgi:hypothetical protein
MDDKDKDQVAGAGVGGAAGLLIGGPVGGLVGSAIGAALSGHEEKHEAVLRESFYEFKEQSSDRAKLYADHIDPDGAKDGNTAGVVSGVEGRPDIVVIDPLTKHLVVEVETWEGIRNDEKHALKQLADFRAQAYQRVLIVPEEDIGDVMEWVEKNEEAGKIKGPELNLASPARLEGYLN